jgi:hypothetical protein
MNRNLLFDCDIHKDIFECPDILVKYSSQFDEYGLIIHDGGSSTLEIYFCPWCGKKLPESKRDRWFDKLEELGINDPSEENIPKEFLSDEWYLKDNKYEETNNLP